MCIDFKAGIGCERSWLSAHISLAAPIYSAEYDRVLVGAITPLITKLQEQRWCDGYFFVRYSDTGPHVRLRVRGIQEVLDCEVRAAIVACAQSLEQPVVWEPYVPETGRYGGAHMMPATEALFVASSRAALSIVSEKNFDDRPNRYGHALLAMVIFAHSITGSRAESAMLLEHYGRGTTADRLSGVPAARWLDKVNSDYDRQRDALEPMVAELLDRLEMRIDDLGSVLRDYRMAIVAYTNETRQLFERNQIRIHMRAFEWRDCVFRLSGSMMHMMNNRLGISIREESYVSLLAARALWSLTPAEALRER